MIIKKIKNAEFNACEVKKINGDGSITVDLLVVDSENVELNREQNYLFVEPIPFQLTEQDIAELNPVIEEERP